VRGLHAGGDVWSDRPGLLVGFVDEDADRGGADDRHDDSSDGGKKKQPFGKDERERRFFGLQVI